MNEGQKAGCIFLGLGTFYSFFAPNFGIGWLGNGQLIGLVLVVLGAILIFFNKKTVDETPKRDTMNDQNGSN